NQAGRCCMKAKCSMKANCDVVEENGEDEGRPVLPESERVASGNEPGTTGDDLRPGRLLTDARRRLLAEGGWLALGALVSTIGVPVGLRVLTHYASPDIYGAFSLLLGIVTITSTVFCNPLLQALLRYYPEVAAAGGVGRLRGVMARALLHATG